MADKGASLSSTSHKASLIQANDSTLPFEPDLVLTSRMCPKWMEEEDQLLRTDPGVRTGAKFKDPLNTTAISGSLISLGCGLEKGTAH